MKTDDKYIILCVDDDAMILKSLKRLFKKLNYQLLTASSGTEGLELLKSIDDSVALIISDQSMPGMCGAEFLEKAKHIVPDAIKFLLTGYSDMDSTIDSINKGEINKYLTKPWNDDELIWQVKQALKQYELVIENRRLHAMTKKQNLQLYEFGKNLEKQVKERSKELLEKNTELEINLFGTVKAFGKLAEMYLPSLQGHGERVGRLSGEMAGHLGLGEEDVISIEIAGMLHDIGKIGLPYSVRGSFNGIGLRGELKLDFMKHPEDGQNIVAFLSRFNNAGILIRHHHEQFDGQGYPDALSGDSIPVGSRIISVADAYDRIVHMKGDNIYIKRFLASKSLDRAHLLPEEIHREAAVYHLKKNAFITYDPEVIKTFVSIYENKIGKQNKEKAVKINYLEEGMILSRNLYNSTGRILLPHKTIIDNDIINRLKKLRKKYLISDTIHVTV